MDSQKAIRFSSHYSHPRRYFIVVSTESACRKQLHKFLTLCDDLGVPIAEGKTFGPLTTLQFAWITLDFITMQASLTEDKLAKCRDQLSSCYGMKHITLRDLKTLIGLLNFTCSVIVPGRAFFRRLIDWTKGIRRPRHFIHITKECKQDIQVWLSFLHQYNGKSFFLPDRWLTSRKLKLYTEAAGFEAITPVHNFSGFSSNLSASVDCVRQICRTIWPVGYSIPSVKCQFSSLLHSTLVNKTSSTGDYLYIHFSHKLCSQAQRIRRSY